MKYDVVIVGTDITACSVAFQCKNLNVLMLDNKDFGDIYRTENIGGIEVFSHGPQVIHTSNKHVWRWLSMFSPITTYYHRSKSILEDAPYSFPINLDTYQRLYHADGPEYAKGLLTENSLWSAEDYLIEKIGDDLYDKFYCAMLTKIWGMSPRLLPSYVVRHIPVRTSYNDFVYDDVHQGIPSFGYTHMLSEMTKHCDIEHADFCSDREYFESLADIIIYTGSVDEYFDYELGELPYRSFEYTMSIEPTSDYQGIGVVNFPDEETVYTRSIEHKHFFPSESKVTIVSKEIPRVYRRGSNMYRKYSIPIQSNFDLYDDYASMDHKAVFAGRKGLYRNMNIEESVLHSFDVFDTHIRKQ